MAKAPDRFGASSSGLMSRFGTALNFLSRESMKTFQELADEAFCDLFQYGRPTDLKAAVRESARPTARASTASRRRHPKGHR
jgi:hypothetical protein